MGWRIQGLGGMGDGRHRGGMMMVLMFNYRRCPSLGFHSLDAVDIWGQINLYVQSV